MLWTLCCSGLIVFSLEFIQPCLIECSNRKTNTLVCLSPLNDSLYDLINSTIIALQKQTNQTIVFKDEPGEFHLKFVFIDRDELMVELYYYEADRRLKFKKHTHIDGIFSVSSSLSRLKSQVTRLLWQINNSNPTDLKLYHALPNDLIQQLNDIDTSRQNYVQFY